MTADRAGCRLRPFSVGVCRLYKEVVPERLAIEPWMTAASTRSVIDALETAGGAGCARFVGGCVRDAVLKRHEPGSEAVIDIDIATHLTPSEVISALGRAGLKSAPTGVKHGTITAISEGRPYEITTLRRDVETDGRRAVVAFSHDWAEDAARRDFRLNALYLDPEGRLYDPTQGGVADALAGRIVFVGDPQARIREDYLRVLRFFRFFAAYGRGEPDAAAVQACAALRDGVSTLSGERVSKELLKLLAAATPLAAIELMEQTGVLAVVLPADIDLRRFRGLIQIEAEGELQRDPCLRLAALMPDDRAEVDILSRHLRLSKVLKLRLTDACTPDGSIGPGLSDREARSAIYRLGAGAFQDRLALAWAAARGEGGAVSSETEQAFRRLLARWRSWAPPRLPITGADIKAAGVSEGPRVGAVRRGLEAWWISKDFPDDRVGLLAELKRLVDTELGA